MAYRTHLLVVGNQTIDSPELLAALAERAGRGPVEVTLLVAAPPGEHDAALQRAGTAAAVLAERGVEARVVLGDDDPVLAVSETWDPTEHDEVVVSTWDPSVSRWLRIDVAQRVARLCNCQVREVVAQPPRPEVRASPVRSRRPDLGAQVAALLGAGRAARI